MGRSFFEVPDYFHWAGDWVHGIKSRTGWTDEEIAKRIGTSSRNLQYITGRYPSGRMALILRILALYIEKTGNSPFYKDLGT